MSAPSPPAAAPPTDAAGHLGLVELVATLLAAGSVAEAEVTIAGATVVVRGLHICGSFPCGSPRDDQAATVRGSARVTVALHESRIRPGPTPAVVRRRRRVPALRLVADLASALAALLSAAAGAVVVLERLLS